MEAVIVKWGNSSALRIPAEAIRRLGLNVNDRVYLDVEDGKLTVAKKPGPEKGTLEYLFKDYSGESFST
ncbi:MAG: AbrB/MazE/SpoVT family DNA-binding domain-containing protein [Treponema sp.]|jgi:antitoxin component of MazEF toxin-antitoxin module|nr:AbrB/MazE/SpoVT family DNA-binding domain-containing protein [Treponema sp.]